MQYISITIENKGLTKSINYEKGTSLKFLIKNAEGKIKETNVTRLKKEDELVCIVDECSIGFEKYDDIIMDVYKKNLKTYIDIFEMFLEFNKIARDIKTDISTKPLVEEYNHEMKGRSGLKSPYDDLEYWSETSDYKRGVFAPHLPQDVLDGIKRFRATIIKLNRKYRLGWSEQAHGLSKILSYKDLEAKTSEVRRLAISCGMNRPRNIVKTYLKLK